MIQSKAIDILKELNRKEFLYFGKYLEFSMATSNKKLPHLFNILKKYYPHFSSPKFTKENIFRSVYNGLVYSDGKTRRLFSDLYKEAESFLVIMGVFSEKDAYNKLLLKQLDRRKLDSLFLSKYEEHNNYLDENKKNSDYFLEKFLTEWRYTLFFMERGMQHKITKNIYKRIEYLIFFFISDLSLSLNDIEVHKISFNTEYNINLAKEFMTDLNHTKLFNYIEKKEFEHKDIVYVYYLGYLINKHFNDESYYYTFKDFVIKNFDKLNEYSQRASMLPLINYCVRKVSIKEEIKFKEDLYQYYSMFIRYKLYNISGKNYIRNDVLLNIFSNFFSVGKTSEIKKFVEDNIANIQPSHRKNMLSLANALFNFENGNFAESLKNVSMIKSNTLLYKDMMKILTLKNHYELKNYEIGKELANNYKDYLNNKDDITDIRRNKRIKFLYYYNLLWKYYEEKKVKMPLKELKKEILNGDSFIELPWILNKIDEFKSK